MADSRAARVTKQIRADIIGGELSAGLRLTEALLTKRYGVSRIPVRESLRALESEGLVVIRPYAGASVAPMPEDDASDLFSIRIELESATARRAAERARDQLAKGQWEESWVEARQRVVEALEGGDEAIARGQLRELAPLNMQFHRGVAEMSNGVSLMSLLEQISGRIEWLYSNNLSRRGGEAWAEHWAVLEAIDSGDATLAANLMVGHVRRSKDTYFMPQPSAVAETSQFRS